MDWFTEVAEEQAGAARWIKQTSEIQNRQRQRLNFIRLSHPRLQGGEVILRKPRGYKRWIIIGCRWPSGKMQGGVEGMSERNLMLDSHTAEVPRLMGKDED